MIDPVILAWMVPGVAQTDKEIDESNDDQRKAAFARMNEDSILTSDDKSKIKKEVESGSVTRSEANRHLKSSGDSIERSKKQIDWLNKLKADNPQGGKYLDSAIDAERRTIDIENKRNAMAKFAISEMDKSK